MIDKHTKQEQKADLIIKIKKLEKDGQLSSFFVHSFLEYLQRSRLNEEKSR